VGRKFGGGEIAYGFAELDLLGRVFEVHNK
jgi:hypothetical protein